MKKLRVTVEGKVYEVLVELLDEVDPSASASGSSASPVAVTANIASIATPIVAPAASNPVIGGEGGIPSPLAGKVVSIDVKVGQAVAEGAQLATLEAMKMNTYLYAPRAGTVSAVLVNAGDGVEEGAVLLRLA